MRVEELLGKAAAEPASQPHHLVAAGCREREHRLRVELDDEVEAEPPGGDDSGSLSAWRTRPAVRGGTIASAAARACPVSHHVAGSSLADERVGACATVEKPSWVSRLA